MGKPSRAGLVAGVFMAITAILPVGVLAAGPQRDGVGTPGNGQPDNDTQRLVLTQAQAEFWQEKQSASDSLGTVGGQDDEVVVMGPIPPCYPDPCPTGPPTSKTLATRARQQITNYNCGPAAGQVVVNWSRDYIFSNTTAAGAQDLSINWKKQSTIAGYMGTTTAGTGGAALAAGLNNQSAVLKPVPLWFYSYDPTGTKQNFHNRVVTDIWEYEMPLILATVPHDAGVGSTHLASWPNVHAGAHHWITIRGYNGLYGSTSPTMQYNDSSGGYGGGTGAYSDLVSILWQVNDWNQGGNMVW